MLCQLSNTHKRAARRVEQAAAAGIRTPHTLAPHKQLSQRHQLTEDYAERALHGGGTCRGEDPLFL